MWSVEHKAVANGSKDVGFNLTAARKSLDAYNANFGYVVAGDDPVNVNPAVEINRSLIKGLIRVSLKIDDISPMEVIEHHNERIRPIRERVEREWWQALCKKESKKWWQFWKKKTIYDEYKV